MRYSGEPSAIGNKEERRFGIAVRRRILNVTNVLVLLWACTIWWGERVMFSNSLEACQWRHWEHWPSGAKPHRVVLIADPQLVDPHTYPGRPWPLSSLTVAYTDLYLRRSYAYLQRSLRPDTLFFLGDLFDGGREWATSRSSSPENRYKRYGNKYWMKEYARFQDIFINGWLDGGLESWGEPRGRKIVASLPGNHDLGFASGIQRPVKERFEAYFGNGNRIDVVGNHTFISVDTVSLSAMDQADPKTGSSGAGDGTSPSAANRDIWATTEEFLSGAREAKTRAVKREFRSLAALREQPYYHSGLNGYAPNLTDLSEARSMTQSEPAFGGVETSFPSILLSHVPLYRAPDTDCGPQRERGHAIPVLAGYQYQNVLSPLISKELVSKLGAEHLTQIYSGDDHDYCEIEHGEFTGRIREVTVKSMSLAMGVRKPGFLAVSLHNPVEVRPAANDQGTELGVKRDTIQNRLCLLPDQLSIFTRYAMMLLLTVVALAVKALVTPTNYHESESGQPLLPLSKEKASHLNNGPLFPDAVSSSSWSSSPEQILSGRTVSAQRTPRAGSPVLGGYGNLPTASRSSSPSKAKLDAAFAPARSANVVSIDEPERGGILRGRQNIRQRRLKGFIVAFGYSIARVAIPALIFYAWLIRRG